MSEGGGLRDVMSGWEPWREELADLLKRESVRLGSFTLASGRMSHYYVDGRLATLSARGAVLIGRGMLEALAEFPQVEAVGGLTMGADPIVGSMLALAGEFGRPNLIGFLVRKETKGHGTGRRIEGPIRPGLTVAIVDDVATTGGSSLQAIEEVERAGCRVAVVLAALDRLEGAAASFAARQLPFRPLLTIRDLGIEPLPSSSHQNPFKRRSEE